MNDVIHVTIIDPQHDFCNPDGALSVPGALEAMRQMAKFIERGAGAVDEINVSQDSHYPLHIANPGMVVDRQGRHPDTRLPHHGGDGPLLITLDMAESGEYRCAYPSLQPVWLSFPFRS